MFLLGNMIFQMLMLRKGLRIFQKKLKVSSIASCVQNQGKHYLDVISHLWGYICRLSSYCPLLKFHAANIEVHLNS